MKRKPKWQLDFETQLSLTSCEDLLARYVGFGNIPFDLKMPLTRVYKKRDMIREEILMRLEPWSFAKGSFDPMGN